MKMIKASIAFALAAPSLLQGQSWDHEWAIQDVMLPKSEPGSDFYWFGGISLGDLDQDSRMDYLLEGRTNWGGAHFPPYENQSRFFSGLGLNEDTRYNFDSSSGRFKPTAHPREPDIALAKTAGGHQMFIIDCLVYELAIINLDTRQLLGYAERPPFDPTWGGLSGYDGLFRAGDLNSDGFEDVFYHAHSTGGARMFGAVSGLDYSLIWFHYEPYLNSDLQPNRNLELEVNGDLDGDLIPDFVASFNSINPTTWVQVGVTKAFSGADGSVLWEQRRDNAPTYGNNGGWRDVNADGVPDFFRTNIAGGLFSHLSMVEMFDGATGTLLWQTDWHVLDHLFPAGDYQPNRYSFLQASPGNGVNQDLVQVTAYYNSTPGAPDQWGTTIYDASTGLFLDYAPFPANQEPWFPDSMNSFAGQFYMPLGDIDRDGFVEVFHDADITQFDEPTIFGLPRAGHILSQQTLALPATIAPGSILQADVLIPTGAGRPCTLLLSTAFDNTGGLTLGENWRLHLAPSPLLTMSLANRPFSTTLDPQGEGSIQLGVPNNPGLIGTTIYARGVIQETAGSPEIWTVTTLAMTEIQ